MKTVGVKRQGDNKEPYQDDTPILNKFINCGEVEIEETIPPKQVNTYVLLERGSNNKHCDHLYVDLTNHLAQTTIDTQRVIYRATESKRRGRRGKGQGGGVGQRTHSNKVERENKYY